MTQKIYSATPLVCRGGLPKIRQRLGIQITDFTRGVTRSSKAEMIGKRGLNYEKEIQKILVRRFGEVFVHEQKPFNDYVGRLDFFVYAKEEFGIDVFYAEDIYSFIGCINYKQKLYKNFTDTLILLQINPGINQKSIDKCVRAKKNILPNNIRVLDLENFKTWITSIEALRVC